MGGINFGWLTVWVLSPDWLSRKLKVCEVCQALWGTYREVMICGLYTMAEHQKDRTKTYIFCALWH